MAYVKQEAKSTANSGKRMPVQSYKYGSVKTNIWENPGKNGGVFYTVAQTRSYQDKEGNWQDTSSFRKLDLPNCILGMQDAMKYLNSVQTE